MKQLLCIFFFTVILSHAETAQDIAKKAFGSTVLLVMEDANGQTLSLGSGFFVREGEIATNLHVITGAARGYAKLLGNKTKHDIEGITAVDPERDLVLLKISSAKAPSLPIGDSDGFQVGEAVYAVGNPEGLEGTFSQGIVSSIREVGTDKLLQITAPISPGSSGGPILNEKGEVIGISVATFKSGQNLNFAIPSNYLKPLLASSSPAKPLTPEISAKAPHSILTNFGGRNSEGMDASSFTFDSEMFHMGSFSFSLLNKLRSSVRKVYCLVIFYDQNGAPLDTVKIRYNEEIPSGLAKRVTGQVEKSVEELNAANRMNRNYEIEKSVPGKISFRILDFETVE